MEKTATAIAWDHCDVYRLEVRFLSPTVRLRPTGGVRPLAFGIDAPTTSPPGLQLIG